MCVRNAYRLRSYNGGSRERETIESPAVRIVRYSETPLLAEKMRSCTLIFVALATVLLCIEYANAQEICPQENCVVPDKCEELVKSDTSCQQQGTLCCSVVKSEFRTHCRHHGGICTNSCSPTLQHETDDCTDGQVCCVLV